MNRLFLHFLPLLLAVLTSGTVTGQPVAQSFVRVEAGLEEAVQWKWDQKPSTGIPWARPMSAAPASGPEIEPTTPLALRTESGDTTYTVVRGDALIKIARKFGVTVDQLKFANDLTGDLIRVGDELRIPTPEEIALMPAPTPKTGTTTPSKPQAGPRLPPDVDREILLFQIFLDRQGFSVGAIDGQMNLGFQKLIFLYQNEHPHLKDLEALRTTARAEVENLFTSYRLTPEDFAFIAQEPSKPSRGRGRSPAPSYESMVSLPFLPYRSAWEFVAERFHCNEKLLRSLNPEIRSVPVAGTSFLVPNVLPFEIASALEEPIQPTADPASPVTARIADLARLEIYQSDKLVAVFPVSSARPGLRGRGTWTILNAIPKPRLATVREPRVAPKTYTMPGEEEANQAQHRPEPEFLPPGPRNPAGVLWINLAKEGEEEPLPYGLHGTSTPDQMFTTESLGGFRMTNWDVVRAARLLPEGTPLRWR